MMNTHKILWSLLAVFLATSLIAKSAAAGDVKIAFVDLRRALMETNAVKKALKKLTQHKNKMQKGIEKKEKAILDMKGQIEKQQNILNKEALQAKVEKYYQSVTELQQTYMQFQKELSAKEAKATQSIFVKMQKILKSIGQSDGYTMIYDSSSGAVVWAPSHLDLTDELIKQYNAKNK